jgi:hypothetical protein
MAKERDVKFKEGKLGKEGGGFGRSARAICCCSVASGRWESAILQTPEFVSSGGILLLTGKGK